MTVKIQLKSRDVEKRHTPGASTYNKLIVKKRTNITLKYAISLFSPKFELQITILCFLYISLAEKFDLKNEN